MLQISVSHNERSFNLSCGVVWRAQNILTQYRFKNILFHIHHLVKTRTDRKFPANPRTPTPAKVTIIITTQANQIFFSVLAFLSKGHQAPKTPTLHHNPVIWEQMYYFHIL